MQVIKKYLFNKLNLPKIKKKFSDEKIVIIDRQRFPSVVKNYAAIEILRKKNDFDIEVITDLKKDNEIRLFYNFIGIDKIIKSFKLIYIILYPLIFLKLFFYFFYYFVFFLNNDLRSFIYRFKVSGIKIGDIIYDRYIRNDFSFIKANCYDLKLIRIYLFTIYKLFWIENYLRKKNVKLIIVNTHIYANNYSIGYKLAKKLKINLLYLKDFQITYFKNGIINKKTDPRAIIKKKLNKLKFSTKEKKEIRKYMSKRISGKLAHFDVKNAFGSKKKLINVFLKKNKINIKHYSKVVLLASHSLSDANHFHHEIGSFSPFKDYYSQLKETLEFAKNNSHILFFVRPHPSSNFWREEGVIKKLLLSYKYKNIHLLDKRINTDDAIKISDTVITVYGTIGIETASFYKKKPILAGKSVYSGLGFTLDSNTKKDYFNHILSNKKKFKLNNIEQQIADKAFYYHFLKLNIDYKSVIANRDRNMSDKKYFNNLNFFLKKNSLKSDRYYKELNNNINNVKF